MYLAARAWGIQPSEFWDMTLVEWMLEAQFHTEQSEKTPRSPGQLSQSEIDRFRAIVEAG